MTTKKAGVTGFSPYRVTHLMLAPLRYFFQNYAPADFKWDPDSKISKIDISSVSDFNKQVIETVPRILIDRGNYQVNKTGLTDNMASAPSVYAAGGKMHRTNMTFIDGVAQIIIEARNEGTCEILTDMVSHFIVWTRPFICDSQGFNEFGLPLAVSSCAPDTENIEKFKTTISVPYRVEEMWQVDIEALKLRGFFEQLTMVN